MRDITPPKLPRDTDGKSQLCLGHTQFGLQLLKVLATMVVQREEERLLKRPRRTDIG